MRARQMEWTVGMRIARNSLRITSRFAIVLVVLVPVLVAITLAGYFGLRSSDERSTELYNDHFVAAQQVSALESALQNAERTTQQIFQGDDQSQVPALIDVLVTQRLPAVQTAIDEVVALSADDPREGPSADSIRASWTTIQSVLASGGLTGSDQATRASTSTKLNAAYDQAIDSAGTINKVEVDQARAAFEAARSNYHASVIVMISAGLLGLLLSIGTVVWLIRSVLPRTLSYSAFADQISHGNYDGRLTPSGDDELAQLGRVLDDLADRRAIDDIYDRNQRGLINALQLTEGESEAHDLVQRHLQRSIPSSTVTVLNRNNSADRLQAMTTVAPDSPLVAGLESAKPRSCLAIRKARPHCSDDAEDDLLSCTVCSGCPEMTTCTPLTVGGEIIGSVLTQHEMDLTATNERAIREAVTLAAPVIGNLRNLAIAELRAATDSLTGLPNRRAIADTIRRMAAQTTRTMRPLAALMCDLDHFKQINDQYGHGRGDDVLAAVGAVLSSSIRASDFAGRFGGEEFLILLPDTDSIGAIALAEKIRSAVAAIQVPTIDRTITLSVGIAVLPDDALDADGLQRAADRALYTAKNSGRNKVEVFSTQSLITSPPPSKTDLVAQVVSAE
jgi:diguanylate cyclase (GGDEF)-like protein